MVLGQSIHCLIMWCSSQTCYVMMILMCALQFPRANVGSIISKIRSIPEDKQNDIKQFLTLSDPGNTGMIPYEPFRYESPGI